MLPRECDNDECDYETYVDGNGVPRAKWVHVPDCRPSFGADSDLLTTYRYG